VRWQESFWNNNGLENREQNVNFALLFLRLSNNGIVGSCCDSLKSNMINDNDELLSLYVNYVIFSAKVDDIARKFIYIVLIIVFVDGHNEVVGRRGLTFSIWKLCQEIIRAHIKNCTVLKSFLCT
jgi:hypothetical protein